MILLSEIAKGSFHVLSLLGPLLSNWKLAIPIVSDDCLHRVSPWFLLWADDTPRWYTHFWTIIFNWECANIVILGLLVIAISFCYPHTELYLLRGRGGWHGLLSNWRPWRQGATLVLFHAPWRESYGIFALHQGWEGFILVVADGLFLSRRRRWSLSLFLFWSSCRRCCIVLCW